jgi:MoxR-like ATPase
MNLDSTRERSRGEIAAHVVGRERELELILAAIEAGRDLILEGPPGTSKSTMLKAITNAWSVPFVFVEGNADLTSTKLVGHHNPSRVLRDDYSPDNFVAGPLVRAMQEGAFLYIEEFNRAPEDTLNTLLTAMAERTLTIPRMGTVRARASFRVIASMNPNDDVGTTRLSAGIRDRLCRLAIGYQNEDAELDIVRRRAEDQLTGLPVELRERVVADSVAVTRATRDHDDIRQGSSVRGAIDCTTVLGRLLLLRSVTSPEDLEYATALYDAMVVSLSGRIHLDDAVLHAPEHVLREIWQAHLLLAAAADPG